jgi:hypothetical protein
MTKPVFASLLLTLTLSLATGHIAQAAEAPMSNDDVAQMVTSGLSEDVIIGAISANDVKFDVSARALLALKKAGVADKVVQAMLAAETRKRDPRAQKPLSTAEAEPAPARETLAGTRTGAMGVPILNSSASQGPAQLPTVTLVLGEKRQPMPVSLTEIAKSKGKGGSAAGSVAKGFGKGMMMAGGMAGAPMPKVGGGAPRMPGVAYTWALPGRQSPFTISSATPRFEIEFNDIPGVDPDEYEAVLVKLIQTRDNWRLVSSSKDKFDKHGNDTRSEKAEDRVSLSVASAGRGHLTVTPAAPLAAGEYGLILHPKKSLKEFAGVPNTNVDAIFLSVWDFSLAPGTPADLVANRNPRATPKH